MKDRGSGKLQAALFGQGINVAGGYSAVCEANRP